MGRIGLAISPAEPDIVYADRRGVETKAGGFFRSTDRRRELGEAWATTVEWPAVLPRARRRSEERRPRLLDGHVHAGHRGRREDLPERPARRCKHVDNHALWIDPADTEHLIAGATAGVYESFDRGRHLGLQGEPARHAVLPGRRGRLEAVLQRLRRHAGQLHARRAVPHRRRRTASRTPTGS